MNCVYLTECSNGEANGLVIFSYLSSQFMFERSRGVNGEGEEACL